MRIKPNLPIISDDTWNSGKNYCSKSRVNLFDFCQIKYKKQYIDKVIPYEETHATSIGTRFHEFAELFVNDCTNYDQSEWRQFIHPDFTVEEIPLLEWFIENEKFRRACKKEPIALEYRIVDHKNQLRGIIDRIDIINDDTIEIIEYKTNKSFKKSISIEFAFYDLLIDSIKELEGYKRKYVLINPRLQKELDCKVSRRSTILNRINLIKNLEVFKPLCKSDYALPFCNLCTLEEISEFNCLFNEIKDCKNE